MSVSRSRSRSKSRFSGGHLLLQLIVVAVEEAKDRLRNYQPVMHPVSSLGSLVCNVLLHAAGVHTHLKLPLYVLLVEFHVPLARK